MTMPSDIDPQSGFRLPLRKREDLDDAGQRAYDRATTPGKTIVGLRGPGGIHLYSTKTVAAHTTINDICAITPASIRKSGKSPFSPWRARWTAGSNGRRMSPKR